MRACYWVRHTAATRDVGTFAQAVRDRLRASGWRIRGDVVPDLEPDDDGGLKARKERFTRDRH